MGLNDGEGILDDKKVFGEVIKALVGGTVIIVCLIWIIISFLLGFSWYPDAYKHNLAVALVNNDQPPLDDRTLRIPPMGEFILNGVVNNTVNQHNPGAPIIYGWHYLDPTPYEEMVDRLEAGEFWGVVFIPENYTVNLNRSIFLLHNNPANFHLFNQTILYILSQGRHQRTAVVNMIPDFAQFINPLNTPYSTLVEQEYRLFNRSTDNNLVQIGDPGALFNPVRFAFDIHDPVMAVGFFDSTGVGYILMFLVTEAAVNVINTASAGLAEAKVKPYQIVFLRIFWLMLNGFFLSLSYTGTVASLGLRPVRGFVPFWMWNYLAISAWGVAIAFLQVTFGPFSQVLGIIFLIFSFSCSSGLITLELSPGFFQIGRWMPFFNASQGGRTIVSGGYDRLGTNAGVLIAWFFGLQFMACVSALLQLEQQVNKTPGPIQTLFLSVFSTTRQPKGTAGPDDLRSHQASA